MVSYGPVVKLGCVVSVGNGIGVVEDKYIDAEFPSKPLFVFIILILIEPPVPGILHDQSRHGNRHGIHPPVGKLGDQDVFQVLDRDALFDDFLGENRVSLVIDAVAVTVGIDIVQECDYKQADIVFHFAGDAGCFLFLLFLLPCFKAEITQVCSLCRLQQPLHHRAVPVRIQEPGQLQQGQRLSELP